MFFILFARNWTSLVNDTDKMLIFWWRLKADKANINIEFSINWNGSNGFNEYFVFNLNFESACPFKFKLYTSSRFIFVEIMFLLDPNFFFIASGSIFFFGFRALLQPIFAIMIHSINWKRRHRSENIKNANFHKLKL